MRKLNFTESRGVKVMGMVGVVSRADGWRLIGRVKARVQSVSVIATSPAEEAS